MRGVRAARFAEELTQWRRKSSGVQVPLLRLVCCARAPFLKCGVLLWSRASLRGLQAEDLELRALGLALR
eukprot:1845183-Alexandrium_andersonii.AAC.1